MAEAGLPAPEYRQNEFMVYVTIRQHGDAVTTEKTTEKILSLILENPNITTEELKSLVSLFEKYGFRPVAEKPHPMGTTELRKGGATEGRSEWVMVKRMVND